MTIPQLKDLSTDSLLQLTAALGLKGQITAQVISDNMLNLTKETVDDSASVRIVTFVTLVYLPASFVSVSIDLMQWRPD